MIDAAKLATVWGELEVAWVENLTKVPRWQEMLEAWHGFTNLKQPPRLADIWLILALTDILRRDHEVSPLTQEETARLCRKTITDLSGTDILFRAWKGPVLPEAICQTVRDIGLDWGGCEKLESVAKAEGWTYLDSGTEFHAFRKGDVVAKIAWEHSELPASSMLGYSLTTETSIFAPVLGAKDNVLYQAYGGTPLANWNDAIVEHGVSEKTLLEQVDSLRPFFELGLFPYDLDEPGNCCITAEGKLQIVDVSFAPISTEHTWAETRKQFLIDEG